jgi:ATP-binding cassette subfamily B protein
MPKGMRGLVACLWKYRHLALPGLVFLLLSDSAQLAMPLIVGRTLDALGAAARDTNLLARYLGLLILLTGIILVSRFLWRHFLFSAARLAEVDLRRKILERCLSLPVSYFATTTTGQIMALATNDGPAVRMALSMGVVSALDALFYTAVALTTMLVLDWRLTLWTILPLPLLFGAMAISLRLIYDRWDVVQKTFEELTEKARESLAGMRVLRAYVQEEGDLRDFLRYNERYYRDQMGFIRVDSLFNPAVSLLAGLTTAILLGVGGADVIRGRLTLGEFTSFSIYLGMLTWPMIAAGWTLSLMQRGAASMARILDLTELAPEPDTCAPASVAAEARTSPPELEARHLTFTYPGAARPALVDLSFRVPRGGSLGVVGEVGSGKSTLAQLLLRLYNPPPGTLFVQGRDVLEMGLTELRRRIAWVPQEPFLFSDTIAENLRLGAAEAADEMLEKACRQAAVHEEILEFPRGYQTVLGERGITLSGGQKQRLCLARALLDPAPILLLDDTFSAVDAESERRILDSLGEALRGRTLLVISHRLSAVRDLDWILVLRQGQVVQEGRHRDLVAQPGYYRDLYELQQLEA